MACPLFANPRMVGHIHMSGNTKIIIFLGALCCVTFSIIWRWFRARFILKKWARANGYELVKINMNWFGISPFIFISNRQEVYQISVRDQRGRERRGWAKCGGFWLGFLADKTEVEWDSVLKAKKNKQNNEKHQTIKIKIGKIVTFVCKWVVIGVVTVIFFLIYWWVRWPSRHR